MSAFLASTVFAPLESLLNTVLKQDPAALHKLQALCSENPHPVVSMASTSTPRWQLFVMVDTTQVQLRAVYDGPISASVSGTNAAFSRLLMAKDVRTALFDKGIELSGDTHLVQGLYEVFRDLNIDWEHHFAGFTGDVFTQQFSNAMTSMRNWSGNAADSMRQNLQEYLHEETRILPQRAELEEFYTEVDELRLRLDRLEARLRRLSSDADSAS